MAQRWNYEQAFPMSKSCLFKFELNAKPFLTENDFHWSMINDRTSIELISWNKFSLYTFNLCAMSGITYGGMVATRKFSNGLSNILIACQKSHSISFTPGSQRSNVISCVRTGSKIFLLSHLESFIFQ